MLTIILDNPKLVMLFLMVGTIILLSHFGQPSQHQT